MMNKMAGTHILLVRDTYYSVAPQWSDPVPAQNGPDTSTLHGAASFTFSFET